MFAVLQNFPISPAFDSAAHAKSLWQNAPKHHCQPDYFNFLFEIILLVKSWSQLTLAHKALKSFLFKKELEDWEVEQTELTQHENALCCSDIIRKKIGFFSLFETHFKAFKIIFSSTCNVVSLIVARQHLGIKIKSAPTFSEEVWISIFCHQCLCVIAVIQKEYEGRKDVWVRWTFTIFMFISYHSTRCIRAL